MLKDLRRLCAAPRPEPLTLREIAEGCNFDHKQIHLIERTALRKFRELCPPELKEELADYMARGRQKARATSTKNNARSVDSES